MGAISLNVPILAYHKVDNKFELGINRISVTAFEKQIKYLQQQHYYSISLSDLKNKKFESENRFPVIITFDDADESIYQNVFPILDKYCFKATVFVISNFVGKYNKWDYNFFGNRSRHLNWEQIKILSQHGWEIGSHTATHQDLTRLSDNQALFELTESKFKISEILNKSVDYISYPFNRFNEHVISLAREANYKGGCTLSSRNYSNKKLSEFAIQRIGVYSIDSLKAYKNKLNNSRFELSKQKVISFFSIGTILFNLLKNKNNY